LSKTPAERDTLWNQAASVLLAALLLGVCTALLLYLRGATDDQRPYTILYLIPVAVGASLLGVRGGVVAALAAVILARIYLFNDERHGLALIDTLPHLSEDIEFASLAVGTLTIALVTGHLRQTLGLLRVTVEDLAAANARLTDSEQQRRVFNRDVLLAVTGGKLRLVEPDDMPPPDLRAAGPVLTLPLQETSDAGALRHAIQNLAAQAEMDAGRVADLCTSVTEAATNAIKHGGGGTARVWSEASNIWVQIQDRGVGIAPAQLARATLEAGYSTRVSLGMGFHMMLQTADALALCTSDQGTTILLQVANRPRATEQEALLARYASL
jgi:anti-sigma regulatory factor (Ser/Thr protein kinase)